MDDDQYDEFGNFIGDINDLSSGSEDEALPSGEQVSGDESDVVQDDEENEDGEDAEDEIEGDDANPGALVKRQSLSEHFHKAETVIVDATAEGDEQPVIRPAVEKKVNREYKADSLPETTYSKEYMAQLQRDLPERARNVAVVGHLHSGKTSFLDRLVMHTHPGIHPSKKDEQEFKPMRYLDTHIMESERGVTISISPLTLLLGDSKEKSHVVTFLDCPGHPDFDEETLSALDVVESAIVVLDIVEGCTKRDKRIITELIKRDLPFVVVLNKFDRLLLELRLPVADAYLKIKYTLDDLNAHIHHNDFILSYTKEKLISPLNNTVLFSSLTLDMTFTLKTWLRLYESKFGGIDEAMLEKLLWGDVHLDQEKGKFVKVHGELVPRTFQQLVLDPIYKLLSYSLTFENVKSSRLPLLLRDNFGVTLHKSVYSSDPHILLKEVFLSVCSGSVGHFMDLLVVNSPSPVSQKETTEDLEAVVFKLIPGGNALVKLQKGVLKVGDKVRVLGDNYVTDEDDQKLQTVTAIYIPGGRYNFAVGEICSGTIAVVSGISSSIYKFATVFSAHSRKELLRLLHKTLVGDKSTYKVAIECENPSDLPKLVEALRTLSKYYISAIAKLEESGEHVLLGPGELYLDCFLYDVRYFFDEYLSIKVSDPMVKFSETCGEQSVTKISAQTPSKQSLISITAEAVNDKRLSSAIQQGVISLSQPQKTTAKILRNDFGWDALAARSLWCFGPKDLQSPSMLLDDTLEDETDKDTLLQAKDFVVAGFNMAIWEGPLCGEAIRNTKFKILDSILEGKGVVSSGSQVIPMTRNAVHIGLLTASPKLLEPMYRAHIICTYRSITAVHTILERRRGWAVSENPIVATQLYEIEGYVPVIDSVGLDTDMRLQTQGQAYCSLEFTRWDVVPGDPLETDCPLPAMKPVPRESMARDFVMKTRKRKGLSGEPNLQKYIDPSLYSMLKQSGIVN